MQHKRKDKTKRDKIKGRRPANNVFCARDGGSRREHKEKQESGRNEKTRDKGGKKNKQMKV
eukprot:107235-Ditylum_brightwellii.AAC.1